MNRPFLVAGVALIAGLAAQQPIWGAQALASSSAAASDQGALSVDALISLKRVGSPAIAPDGRWVAYTVREADWEENTYHTEVWLADARTGETHQLTNNRKSSSSPSWAPDSSRLAFASDRDDKRQ